MALDFAQQPLWSGFPICLSCEDGIGVCEEFSGAGGEGLFVVFTGGAQAFVDIDERAVPAEAGWECCGIEGAADTLPAALDTALSAILAAVAVERREPGQAGGFAAAEAAEFGHEDEQSEGGAPTDAGDALDQRQAAGQVALGCDGLGQEEQFGLDPPRQPLGFTL